MNNMTQNWNTQIMAALILANMYYGIIYQIIWNSAEKEKSFTSYQNLS